MHIETGSIDPYLDLETEIKRLKQSLNAVILAHYYQDSEIQDVADYIGDSFELSKKASATDAEIIVFCGVKFMAEAALILNPNKKVILPDLKAGCSLESSCPPHLFRRFREKYPDHVAITYINCSAEIKALSDIIVTSSSAEKIINSVPKDKPIIFAPDKHLGQYLINQTGRDMVLWDGSCVVHENFSEKELVHLKNKHTHADVIAHPECPQSLLNHADFIGSTSALLNYTQEHNGGEFIVLTEPGIIHQMRKVSPNSVFYDVPSLNQSGCTSCSKCEFMKMNTLEKLYLCMKNQAPQITLDPEIVVGAKRSLDLMLQGGYKNQD